MSSLSLPFSSPYPPFFLNSPSATSFELISSAPPIKGSAKEAIKDTGPELVTEDDDAEIEEAIEEGNKTDEILTKAKIKTKSHLKGAFKGIGKKMAGFRGDVAVDGKERMVRVFQKLSSGLLLSSIVT
jgi:hypothetical protein